MSIKCQCCSIGMLLGSKPLSTVKVDCICWDLLQESEQLWLYRIPGRWFEWAYRLNQLVSNLLTCNHLMMHHAPTSSVGHGSYMQDCMDMKAVVLNAVHCCWHVQFGKEQARQAYGH